MLLFSLVTSYFYYLYNRFWIYLIIIATKNGVEVQLSQPAIVINDRTMVPVRIVSEALGIKDYWDETYQQVIITRNNSD